MRLAHALLFVLCCCVAAQSGNRVAAQDKPPQKLPAKKELVAGYRLQKIEGFTFLIQDVVFEQDGSAFERKPLDALALECQTLTKILTPSAVNTLKALTIWVEWDEKVPLANGRKGRSLAVYSAATPSQAVKEGKHPLRAKTVTIHSLKSLAESRQPKRDRGDCVLLHEIAHAVHDQLLGFGHTGIKAAYQQAMERKLYDKDLYIATNEVEFFAELTCAYLDRLRYYPYTRADLQKHDPVSYRLMESIWSAAAKKTHAGKKAANPPDGSDQFDLSLVLPDDVRFGTSLTAPGPTPESMSGKVVLITYWGGNTLNVLNREDRMHEELADYGLLVVAPCILAKPADEIRAEAEKRCEGFAVLDRAFVKDKSATPIVFRSQPGAHALVFDHAGKCVFRGTAYDADRSVRAAVGRMLLEEAVGSKDLPPAFKAVSEAFAAGNEPVSLLPKITPLTNSQDSAVKDAAKKLSDAILAPGQKNLDEAKRVRRADPVAAFLAAEAVAAGYKGTPQAGKAQAFATSIRQERAVVAELKARAILAQIQKAENYLRGQPGSFDPTDSIFQGRHRATLTQIQSAVEQMRKQYPTARATAEAMKIAREFGVE